jgi:hypothetical protein
VHISTHNQCKSVHISTDHHYTSIQIGSIQKTSLFTRNFAPAVGSLNTLSFSLINNN